MHLSLQSSIKMGYKVELVGHMPKHDIVAVYGNQNVSKTSIYRVIKRCEEGLPCMNFPL